MVESYPDSWLLSPSGSRAEVTWPEEIINHPYSFSTQPGEQVYQDVTDGQIYEVQEDDMHGQFLQDNDEMHYASVAADSLASELLPGQLMSPKVPPAFNGRGSWFAYEELIYDWIDITTLDVPKQGPALRNRLTDEAAIYKSILDRERLKTPAGVRYFISTLRPEFIKGVQHIFLYRLIQFFNQRRQNLDIHRWIAKYEIQKRRLLEAWMDLIPELTPEHVSWPTFNAKVEDYCRRKAREVPEDTDERAVIVNEIQKAEHVDKFPFSDNLLTLSWPQDSFLP